MDPYSAENVRLRPVTAVPSGNTAISKVDPTRCVTASSNVIGAPVIIDACDPGAPAQTWTDPLGAKQLAFDNMCITPAGDEINDGVPLVLQPCDASKVDQTWGYGAFALNNGAFAKIVSDLPPRLSPRS